MPPVFGAQRIQVQDRGRGDAGRACLRPGERQHALLGETDDGERPVVRIVDGNKDVLFRQQVDALGPPAQPLEVGAVGVPPQPLRAQRSGLTVSTHVLGLLTQAAFAVAEVNL